MPHNPDQIFVCNFFRRREIAEIANTHIEHTGVYGNVTIQPSDDRLTSEVCQEYVRAISQIDSASSEDFRREAETCAIEHLLRTIGIVEISDARSDAAEVEELKTQIAMLELRLGAKLNEMANKSIFRVT